jgi:ribosomal protein S19
MSRSLYKFPYVHRSLWAKSIKARKHLFYSEVLANRVFPIKSVISNNLYFWKRSSILNKRLAYTNTSIGIHNGLGFHVLHLNNKFFGFRLGEFSVSRRAPRHKGKQRQKKKVK